MLNVGWYCLSRRVLVSPFCYGLSAPPLPLFDPSRWSQTIGQVVVRLSMLCWYVGYCRLVCQGPCGSFWSCRRVFVFYLSRVLLNNLCESLWTPNPYESSRFFKYPSMQITSHHLCKPFIVWLCCRGVCSVVLRSIFLVSSVNHHPNP
jgi:hypothetical protein